VSLGTSRTVWNGLALPFDLAPLGLAGCSVWADWTIQVARSVPATGIAEAFLPVPASGALAGAKLYAQWVNAGDPRVSATLALTSSSGVELTLGTTPAFPGFVLNGDPTAPNGAGWTYKATAGGVAYDLAGLLFKPAAPPAAGRLYPAVVISHGAGGNVNAYSAAIAKVMVGWGLVCIMTNLTHAGGVPLGSPGTANELGASLANAQRNRKCVDVLQSLGYVDMRRVAAHGHSMGAFATGATLGLFPEAFLVGSHTAGGLADQGPNATKTAQARAIVVPYQLHHGDADTTVLLALDQQLLAVLLANPVPTELRVYAGYGHAMISNDAGMLVLVRAWYQAHGLL
jgi:dienelactone hydrolase